METWKAVKKGTVLYTEPGWGWGGGILYTWPYMSHFRGQF